MNFEKSIRSHQYPIPPSLKRKKKMNLPVLRKQIPLNLKNLFMVVRANTTRF